MKTLNKSIAMTAMALVTMNSVATTPLMAETTPTTTTTATMQAACDAVKPAGSQNASQSVYYTSFPYVDSQSSQTIVVDVITIEEQEGGLLLEQTPFTFTTGSEHRNGNSTNVHGNYTSVATYSGAVLVQDIVEQEETVFTFGCEVYRTIESRNNTRTDLAGEGQQQAPTLSVTQLGEQTTRRVEERQPNTFVTLNDERVICNSPGRRGGVWTNQNGYTGTCSSELYLSVALGGPIPSNSVPGVTRLLPSAVATTPTPDNLYAPQLPNAPEDFLEE